MAQQAQQQQTDDTTTIENATIQDIEEREGKKGPYYKMKIAGATHNYFGSLTLTGPDGNEVGRIEEGDVVTVDEVRDGDWTNWENFRAVRKKNQADLNGDLPEDYTPTVKQEEDGGGSGSSASSDSDHMADYVTWEDTLAQLFDEYDEVTITTQIVQNPNEMQHATAWIVKAVVECDKGTFSGIGDASPKNVQEHIANALPRMAETRAMSRAAKHALGIGKTGKEEIPDE